MTAANVAASAFAATTPAGEHQFDAWLRQRAELDDMLDLVPEENERARDRIFDRYSALERLILRTRCLDLPAIKAKAGILLWLMEMESSDGLPAMRHIKAYIDRSGLAGRLAACWNQSTPESHDGQAQDGQRPGVKGGEAVA